MKQIHFKSFKILKGFYEWF